MLDKRKSIELISVGFFIDRKKKIKKNCAKVLLIKKLVYICKVNKAQNKKTKQI